jgi:hypothetical protein
VGQELFFTFLTAIVLTLARHIFARITQTHTDTFKIVLTKPPFTQVNNPDPSTSTHRARKDVTIKKRNLSLKSTWENQTGTSQRV